MNNVKPDECTCSYPEVVFRNGSGHNPDCICHKQFEEKFWKKQNMNNKPMPPKAKRIIIRTSGSNETGDVYFRDEADFTFFVNNFQPYFQDIHKYNEDKHCWFRINPLYNMLELERFIIQNFPE